MPNFRTEKYRLRNVGINPTAIPEQKKSLKVNSFLNK